MHKVYIPDTVAPPASDYSHAVEVAPGLRWLHTAGQVGVGPEGTAPPDVEAQADQAWRNLVAVLAAAGMAVTDVVRMTMYLVRADDVPVAQAVRTRFMGGHKPASTLIVVAALARPAYLFEIEAVAAKA